MGYSVTVRAKSKKLLVNMWEFMLEHYVSPSELFSQTGNYSRLAININKDSDDSLSYDSSKSAIGFDYNACEPERDYIFSVVKWMALKIGKTFKIKGVGEVPYYVYDGEEKMPIFVKSLWGKNVPEKYSWAVVNNVGFKSLIKKYIGVLSYEKAPNKKAWIDEKLRTYSELTEMSWMEVDNRIHRELKKLDIKYSRIVF
jgi:hypothetical protein